MTAALHALTRIDLGLPLPGDLVVADQYERHCQSAQPAFCLICGVEGQGRECDTCYAAHDHELSRLTDI